MGKHFLLLVCLFFSVNFFAQKEANYWFFGEKTGLNFSTNPPRKINGNLETDEGSASISNADGELQFYTDGSTVYRKDGAIMTNGTDLRGNSSSTQSAIIVPKPETTDVYYVFTVGNESSFNNFGVHYSEVDMSLDGGFGEVTIKNENLSSSNNAREKITSVNGKDCNTFWVVTTDFTNYYAYKIDKNGVNTSAVVSRHSNFSSLRGYLKLSPRADKIVSANQDGNSYLSDFNNETGEITNEKPITRINAAYGVEFSRDGKKLYISTGSHSQLGNDGTRRPPEFASIVQYQLDANNDNVTDNINTINSSYTSIYDTNSGYRGALQLASNGKIYYARSRQNYVGVINFPDKDAADVDFDDQGVNLGTGICTEGLPPFIQSFFLPIEIKDPDTNITINDKDLQYCIGENKTLETQTITGNNITYEWTFDNGTTSNVIASSQNLTLINLAATDAGSYSLKIELTDDCGNLTQYNGTFNIEVFEPASATQPVVVPFCDLDRDGFNSFTLTDYDNEILGGLSSLTFEVHYYDNSTDRDNNTTANALASPYTNPTEFSSQTIYARVQNKNAPNACYDVTDFVLQVTDLPVATQPEHYRICDNLDSGSDTDGIVETFLLNTRDTEILGTLDSNQFNITYHTTQTGADTNDVSTIIDKNTNHTVTNSETVYVRVENKDNTACYDASITLDLIVDPLPVLKPNPELEQCISADNLNPTVNLTNAQINISETANVTFEFYRDNAGTDLITDPTTYPVIVNVIQTIFVKVITDQNCTRDIVELTINVGQTPDNGYDTIQTAECDDLLDADGNDTINNSDTDNITNFSLDKNTIETGINPPANTTVFYYENIQDRANTLNEIDITNYRNDINKIDITNISGGIQFPIYYKIVSNANNNCEGIGQFYLQINATPEISNNNLSPISECDTGTVDGNISNGSNRDIDLTQVETEIFQGTGQNPNDFDVLYFTTDAAATNGSTSVSEYIATPTQFTNQALPSFIVGDVVTQKIYVRVQNINSSCYNAHASFDVIINPLPIITNPIPALEVCDIGSKDGDVRNGLAQNIDVSVRDADILGSRTAADYIITYHKTLADLADLTSSGVDKTNFDSDPARITLNTTSNISEEILYIRVLDNNTNCVFDQSTLTIIVNPEPTIEVISNLSDCDNNDDGNDTNGIIQNIDLDSKITEILGASQDPDDYNVSFHINPADASTGFNKLLTPYENSNPTETIYVRVQNKTTLCVNDSGTFEIIINPLPDFTVTTPQVLCLNDLPLTISVENPSDVYNYVWRDGTNSVISPDDFANISSGGNYTVTATSTDGTSCTRVETIVVQESNPATLESSFITIVDESNNIGSEENLSISIDTINNNLGPGDYQFAILNTDDNTRMPIIGFQDEPLFENLEGGIYQVIVNDKNGCSPDETLLVSVIQFPKFFSPNGDGANDSWVIKGANKTFYPNSSINIFNRFGKLIAQLEIDGEGWDGTYNGNTLSSDDYWFNITLIPADTTKPTINKKGNFSLLRR